MNEFKVAMNAFKIKYDGLPGDIPDASAYWGTTCNPTPANCNGNGNGRIEWNGGAQANESLHAMQELMLAGLMNFNVNGIDPGNGLVSANSPKGAISGSVFALFERTFFGKYSAAPLVMGSDANLTGSFWYAPKLATPIKMHSIDKKMDDGIANSGKMYSADSFTAPSGVCSADMYSSGANYNLSGPGPCLSLWFLF